MAEEDYYVKLVVDGSAVPDDDLCWGNPTSSSCRYKVSKGGLLCTLLLQRLANFTSSVD